MKRAIHIADEIAHHAVPPSYTQRVTPLPPFADDDPFFDPALITMTAQQKLDYVNRAAAGLECDGVSLAGMFSSGAVWEATANSLSDTVLVHATTDAHVSLVLSHERLKWEVASSQSATRLPDLQPEAVHAELAVLLGEYRKQPPMRMPLGACDVVFGREALGDLLSFAVMLGFDGGACKRKMTFLQEEQLGAKHFSAQFTLTDDPRVRETFPYRFDLNGIERRPFPLGEQGVFKQFMWDRDSADEFGQTETGHSVPHVSMVMAPGTAAVASLPEALAMPRERDTLYVPFIHYMNVVNETKGLVTGSSRFGALLLAQDGAIRVPYNVRITDAFFNLFGNIAWLSAAQAAVNTSSTYGERNPTALLVPRFALVNGVQITHANDTY